MRELNKSKGRSKKKKQTKTTRKKNKQMGKNQITRNLIY